jgi:hypothetical protein
VQNFCKFFPENLEEPSNNVGGEVGRRILQRVIGIMGRGRFWLNIMSIGEKLQNYTF